MIKYKDFVPTVEDRGGIFREASFEELSEAVERANNWIGHHGVVVINIETVVLPNIHAENESGSEDQSLRSTGDGFSNWHQFIRVWYREV
ncbi:MAG: hypothetical protein AAFX93_04895 [Verrucomicrobiota bacterium]